MKKITSKAVIGIKPKNLSNITQRLCRLLADEFLLYVKTLNAHWNVEGQDFYNKHLFFENQYSEMSDIIDAVAERIRALGHFAPGTMAEFLKLTHLLEQKPQNNNSERYIKMLLADHYFIIVALRDEINLITQELKDVGTGDFLTSLVERHEKMSWMLRSHLS